MWKINRRGNTITRIIRTAAVALLLYSGAAAALTSVTHSFDELVARSERILVGTVSRIDSTWGTGRDAGTIFSRIQLTEIEAVKGTALNDGYRLRVIGGHIGDQAQFYPGLPRFERGQRYLLFIRGNRRAMFPITGVTQGFYRVQWDANQERRIAVPAGGGTSLSLSRGLQDQPQTGTTRDLNELIGAIRASMAQDE